MSALTPEQKETLLLALHAAIDGDYLVGASSSGDGDVALGEARPSEVVRWAVEALAPVVAQMLAEQPAPAGPSGYLDSTSPTWLTSEPWGVIAARIARELGRRSPYRR